MQQHDTVYVAGGETLIGAACLRRLRQAGFRRVCAFGSNGSSRESQGPDLLDRQQVDDFFRRQRPEYVIHAAGVMGGIGANCASPADLCAENLAVNLHLIEAARRHGVKRLLYLASSCCYPRDAAQPLAPESLWTGPLEPTSQAYAAAKLAGIALCDACRLQDGCDFIAGVPATVFGPGDLADEHHGHVIPALLRKFLKARAQRNPEIEIFGSGAAVREFIAADDLAGACLRVMQSDNPPPLVNLGSGQSLSIAQLVELLVEISGYRGRIRFDTSRPDGALRKELDSTWLFETGWRPSKSLRDWLAATYSCLLQRACDVEPAPPKLVAVRTPTSAHGDNPEASRLDRVLYRQLFRIRRVEEQIATVYPSDKIQSPVHLSIGQEAVAVGVCQALRREDVAFGSYRSHAYYLAKGGDLRGMIAELYGKATGVAKGKAGSMHLIDTSAGVMGASAIVASTLPQAVGYALGVKSRGEDRVVVVFFGEGATEEGVFYESLNFAALQQLPVLFVCENNQYAIHSTQAKRQANLDVCGRAQSFGIQTLRFDRLDLYELFASSCEAVESLRNGAGPRFFECCCYRWMEHVGPSQDFAAGYRDAGEAQPWIDNDVLKLLSARLPERVQRDIEIQVEDEIHDAFVFAERSPCPARDELLSDLYQ